MFIGSVKVTLDLPDDLADDLQSFGEDSASIIAAGLREVQSVGAGQFSGLNEVLHKLAELPSAEEVIALRPAPALDARIRDLLWKSREEGLSREEQDEWRGYEVIEHLVRVAKARAHRKLGTRG